ncbi:hypothetical protein EST38_g5768 [Candolleomyces aberdarensis]|uniref:cAMP-dependent protein kinase n=1 Tax=Candolleomyces aberdarensis TaxID=2316362 RepID=A0A4Q2DMW2_9AGAR|nr:hypothetical protein EST38_g5768 [Candolleomyces aberdarensis]
MPPYRNSHRATSKPVYGLIAPMKWGAAVKKDYVEETEKEDSPPQDLARPTDRRPPPLKLKDLEILKTLGRGQEAHVYLVRTKRQKHTSDRPNSVYALKAIRKKLLRSWFRPENHNQNNHMYRKNAERESLASIGWNPFVAGLVDFFEDRRNVYMMIEFIPRGTLRGLILNGPPIRFRGGAFYFSNIICGLEFLHEAGIVHRDIKPENILVGEDGYLCLADFGSAASLTDIKAPWSNVGTPFYAAPEIQMGPGSPSTSVDLYSAACILFEILSGTLPFVGMTSVETYQLKMDHTIPWPEQPNAFGKDLIDLIDQMLEPEDAFRLTIGEVKKHPWLRQVDWEKQLS